MILINRLLKKYFHIYLTILILFGISFLFINVFISTINTINDEIEKEFDNEYFYDISIQTNIDKNKDFIIEYLINMDETKNVYATDVIYADYENGNIKSDVKGLIYVDYENRFNLQNDEIIAPISIKEDFELIENEKLVFLINRSIATDYTIKEFYDDPIYGSSMIGAKRFFINNDTYNSIINLISTKDNMVIAKSGMDFHIQINDGYTTKNIMDLFYDNPNLGNAIENVFTRTQLISFSKILIGNYLSILLIFAVLVMIVNIFIIYFNISEIINNETKNLSILKILGYEKYSILKIFCYSINIPLLLAILISYIFTLPMQKLIFENTHMSNGFLYTPVIYTFKSICALLVISIMINIIFIIMLDKKLVIKPLGEANKKQIKISNRNSYSVLITSFVLTIFVVGILRINSWIGVNGEGLMNAFNPTDLDIGLQVIKDLEIEDVILDIKNIDEIEYSYMLGMSNLNVEKINLRTNVSTDTSKFHILRGSTIKNKNEVLLTEIVANNLNKNIGDYVTITGPLASFEYKVSGIYECANEMGENIGLSKEGFDIVSDTPQNFYCYHLFLKNKKIKEITDYLEEKYGALLHIHTNTWSGLDSIVKSMKTLLIFILFFIALIVLVVTNVESIKQINNSIRNIAIYKLVGYSPYKLAYEFVFNFFKYSALGNIIGYIVSIIFINSIISNLMKLYGICSFKSEITLFNTIPILFITLFFTIFSSIKSRVIIKIKILQNLNIS